MPLPTKSLVTNTEEEAHTKRRARPGVRRAAWQVEPGGFDGFLVCFRSVYGLFLVGFWAPEGGRRSSVLDRPGGRVETVNRRRVFFVMCLLKHI